MFRANVYARTRTKFFILPAGTVVFAIAFLRRIYALIALMAE